MLENATNTLIFTLNKSLQALIYTALRFGHKMKAHKASKTGDGDGGATITTPCGRVEDMLARCGRGWKAAHQCW